MTEEMLINALAVIGAGTVAWVVVRVLAAIAAWAQRLPEEETAAPPPDQPLRLTSDGPDDAPTEHIAVIAAAIQATLDSHRILVIEDAHTGFTWSAEGRWQHQTSHKTH